MIDDSLEGEGARRTAALLTAAAYGPMNRAAFVAPCDCGLGLFARIPLKRGDMIGEYGGPRLPKSLARSGEFQLEIPKSTVVIDGDCENSPFDDLPRYAACFANHSRECPNARLEKWWELGAIPATEIRERMVLVALEDIAPGTELRFDYEGGNGGQGYWNIMGERPAAGSSWRRAPPPPLPPPPADGAYRNTDPKRVAAYRPKAKTKGNTAAAAAAAAKANALPAEGHADGPPMPWEGARGGDARLRVLVPLLLKNNPSNWPLISTHIPGRSGKECKERWRRVEAAAAVADGRALDLTGAQQVDLTGGGGDVQQAQRRQAPPVAIRIGGRTADGEVISRQRRPMWTAEEDSRLTQLVNELGSAETAWPTIAARIGTGRTPGAVHQHWLMLRQLRAQEQGCFREKVAWTAEEESRLTQLL